LEKSQAIYIAERTNMLRKDRDTEGRQPCKDKERNSNYDATNQKCQELSIEGKKRQEGFFLRDFRGRMFLLMSWFWLLASRTRRE
jgi:hypothetical protein